MTLREELAHAALDAITRQCAFTRAEVALDSHLCAPYVDQGETDFGMVADAMLAVLAAHGRLTPAPRHPRVAPRPGTRRPAVQAAAIA